MKKAVSLRVRNFESSRLKVNDNEGNPIEIAAVVVWKVVETAEAVFEVDDYENYVHVQSESALRNLATSYPYDAHDEPYGLLARPYRGRRRPSEARDSGTTLEGRRRGHRSAHQPPRLRARNRSRHASASTGGRDHRRPSAHRRGCGRYGRHGARDVVSRSPSSPSTRSARRRWSATFWSCCAASEVRSRSSIPARSINRS